jgi:Smg protein
MATGQTMFDILVYLFENYFDTGNCPDSATLTRKLTMAGFDDEEITLALDWLSDLSSHDENRYPARLTESNSMRYFTGEEMEIIDTEGRGFIFFLEQAGVINPLQRELLIDRVIRMDGDTSSVEKIKLVVLFDLWVQDQLTDRSIIEKLFVVSDSHQRH